VFSEAHRQLNFAYGHEEARKEGRFATQLLADLEWTLAVLEQRKPPAEELRESRAVWDWHRQFEKDHSLKAASLRLEAGRAHLNPAKLDHFLGASPDAIDEHDRA
jgi:hypothetical protein